MRIPKPGPILLGLTTAAALAAVPATASASTHWSPVVGHVYVNDNTAGTNTIGAFDRHADGSLTREAGSPFAAGGAGTGAGLSLARRTADLAGWPLPDRRRRRQQPGLGAADLRHGSLRLVHDGVVSSGGVLPVSVAIHGNLVYVANSGNTDSNYTGFWLHRDEQASSPSPARLSRCPVVLSRATCCSTAMAASSPGPASRRR